MGLLITRADFEGRWKLAKSSADEINAYIDEFEPRYLKDLLGQELYDLFAADVTANLVAKVPTDPLYLKIYNALTITYSLGCGEARSEGMKNMLLGFVFFEYVRGNRVKQSVSGDNKQQTEVAAPSDSTYLHLRYNDSILYYQVIQEYILNNLEEYPTFNGNRKRYNSFI